MECAGEGGKHRSIVKVQAKLFFYLVSSIVFHLTFLQFMARQKKKEKKRKENNYSKTTNCAFI
jgi:hypothetical protein